LQVSRSSGSWRRRRYFVIGGLAFSFLVVLGVALFARHFPFSRKHVIESLQEDFHGTITFAHFHRIYFPHPGCVAEGLTLISSTTPAGSPPLVSVQRFTLHANYHDLLFRPGYISSISLEGLHIQIPPLGRIKSSAPTHNSSTTRVGEVLAKDAVLEIARESDKPPLRFEIHSLTLKSVSRTTAIAYDVAFQNPMPPGEIESRGHFGPWNVANAGQTPVSGTYEFDNGDLRVFDGVTGILSARDNFQGVLTRIEAHGRVDIPDFHLTRSVHKIHLQAHYDAVVNAFNGDVQLPRVEAAFLQTMVVASGSVAGRPGQPKKVTSLDMSVRNGRFQDLQRMITNEAQPALNGLTNVHAQVEIPPEGRPFLKELNVIADFVIVDGRFTKPQTQKQIVDLSDRSRGRKAPGDPETALSEDIRSSASGHVVLKNGIATLNHIAFSVPGAVADMHGTFNVLNEKLDFHGTLKTDASFSKTAGGVKSVFLKPLDTIFKKKPRGAAIPVKMDGTYSDPHPGVELTGNKSGSGSKSREPGQPADTDKPK
jgi:AsmA-like C-terminal region